VVRDTEEHTSHALLLTLALVMVTQWSSVLAFHAKTWSSSSSTPQVFTVLVVSSPKDPEVREGILIFFFLFFFFLCVFVFVFVFVFFDI
jgi:hypothetical protein